METRFRYLGIVCVALSLLLSAPLAQSQMVPAVTLSTVTTFDWVSDGTYTYTIRYTIVVDSLTGTVYSVTVDILTIAKTKNTLA